MNAIEWQEYYEKAGRRELELALKSCSQETQSAFNLGDVDVVALLIDRDGQVWLYEVIEDPPKVAGYYGPASNDLGDNVLIGARSYGVTIHDGTL